MLVRNQTYSPMITVLPTCLHQLAKSVSVNNAINTSDVTKLVKIRIRILTFKIDD